MILKWLPLQAVVRFAIVVFSVVLAVRFCTGDDVDSRIKKLCSLSTPQEFSKERTRLLSNRQPVAGPSIPAIDTAWLYTQWTLAQRQQTPASNRIGSSVSENHEFIETLKEIFQRIPGSWKEVVLNGKRNTDDSLSFSRSLASKYLRSDDSIFHRPGMWIAERNGKLILHCDTADILLSSAGLSLSSCRFKFFDAQELSGNVVVAIHSNRASSFELLCFDGATSHVLWKTTVWVTASRVVLGGTGFHQVFLSEEDGKVSVFGVCNDCFYIECFQASSGDNVARFSTAY